MWIPEDKVNPNVTRFSGSYIYEYLWLGNNQSIQSTQWTPFSTFLPALWGKGSLPCLYHQRENKLRFWSHGLYSKVKLSCGAIVKMCISLGPYLEQKWNPSFSICKYRTMLYNLRRILRLESFNSILSTQVTSDPQALNAKQKT